MKKPSNGCARTRSSGFVHTGPESWLQNNQLDLSVSGIISLKRYWHTEARAGLPRLPGGSFAEFHVSRSEYPQEDFWGLGPESRRADRVSYALHTAAFGGSAGRRLRPWLTLGGGLDYLMPSIGRGADPRFPSIEDTYTERDAPGLQAQPDFLRLGGFLDLNYRQPRDNPRDGGRYQVGFWHFQDRDQNRYSFRRLDVDVEQYVPFVKQRRVIALRALVSMSQPLDGHEVPFYLQRTLGGSSTLRGFREYRYRDRNLLLLQEEYRWEIFAALDAALFYDLGKTVPRASDLNLQGLESQLRIRVPGRPQRRRVPARRHGVRRDGETAVLPEAGARVLAKLRLKPSSEKRVGGRLRFARWSLGGIFQGPRYAGASRASAEM